LLVTSTEIALIVLACVFSGALIGNLLRAVVPDHHLTEASKEVIKLGMALIVTMTALVLGLMVASAKGSYDAQDEAVRHTAAKLLLLDRTLSNYGPETKDARNMLRRIVASRVSAIWPEDRSKPARLDSPEAAFAAQDIENGIMNLSPRTDVQRRLQSQALQTFSDIIETRWLILGDLGRSVPVPFLVVVVFWLTIIFGSFGLFAPRNITVLAVLFLCAVSVAGSIFLILEMARPFEGIMKISSAPLHYTLSHLGQ
jgi:hypothetical protein